MVQYGEGERSLALLGCCVPAEFSEDYAKAVVR